MLPEVQSLESALKQILYGCVEHVQATKAALYLCTSRDLNDKRYEIVTHYQYNPADRKMINANDDLVTRLTVKRTPFYVNGLSTDQRFAEILFSQGNDRLLAAPIFSRGRLVGFIDMRDKAGRKPFETGDVQAAQKIADDMLLVLMKNNLYGLAPLPVTEDSTGSVASFEEIAPPPPAPPPPPLAGGALSAEAMHAIESARQFMTRRQLHRETATRVLGDGDLDTVRVVLPAVLAIPDAVLGAFSAIGHTNNPQLIVATGTVGEEALAKVQSHLEAWLKRTNQTRLLMRPDVSYPFGTPETMLDPSSLLPFSAPVHVYSVEGLVLTVAFEKQPGAEAQRALKTMLHQLELTVEAAISTTSGHSERTVIAERLLEPDFRKFPDLAGHSREVASIAQRLARAIELPPMQIETIRIAALVHDVGLRVLDYERLYRRPALTAEELRGLAEHPVVGAALVEPLLGADVAQAVLRHHERVDGKGYPSRMQGTQIPLASRIIQIADAWVAMTSRHSYQIPVDRQKASEQLREGAGTQFDAALVERFLRSLDEIAP